MTDSTGSQRRGQRRRGGRRRLSATAHEIVSNPYAEVGSGAGGTGDKFINSCTAGHLALSELGFNGIVGLLRVGKGLTN